MELGGGAEVFDITVAEGAAIAGTTFQEAADADILPTEMLVVAIDRPGDEKPVTPRGDTPIPVGDVVTVYLFYCRL